MKAYINISPHIREGILEGLREYLQNELVKRCKKNSAYSLRSFARTLNLSHSALSEILNGKRKISEKNAIRIASQLGLSVQDLQAMQKHSHFSLGHIQFLHLSPEQQFEMSDWYYYAIWELCSLKNNKADKNWIAKALGIHPQQAQEAINRMLHLNLIHIKNGKLNKSKAELLDYTNSQQTTGTRKKLQKQFFEKALSAIDEIPYEQRHHSGMTMAIDAAKLNEAKELIKDFRRKLMKFLESGANNNSVYHLSVGLFPLSTDIIENKFKNKKEKKI